MNIEIIHAPTDSKPFLVIYKPKGLASAPLTEGDTENALAQAIEMFPEICGVHGKKEIEYGLLHRLDTATDGLMVIATTQECYDFLTEEQREGRFIKYYSALCDILPDNPKELGGFPPDTPISSLRAQSAKQSITATSYFRPYGEGRKEVRPVTENSGKAALRKIGKQKEYTTEIKLIEKNEISYKFECRISSGYRHQVRCHLAWLDFPIIGDKIYNFSELNSEKTEKMRFKAVGLQFTNPITLKKEEIIL